MLKLRRWILAIDWRAMKKEWKQHAEREMKDRAEWWKSKGNGRLSKEYLDAIDEMNRTNGVNTSVDDDYQD